MIDKKIAGYEYTEEGKNFKVTTDYICGNIYLSAPKEEDIASIEAFGKAIQLAVKDYKRDMK